MFAQLQRNGNSLYRGSSGIPRRILMESTGIGPLKRAARMLADSPYLIPEPAKDSMEAYLMPILRANGWTRDVETGELAAKTLIAMPIGPTFEDRLDKVLRQLELVGNNLTPLEHVVPEEQANSFPTGRLMESASKSPQIALLYAYGIRIDPFIQQRHVTFAGSGPNQDCFVAVAIPHADPPLAQPYDVSFAGEQLGMDECRRRISRDSEVLFADMTPASRIILLPAFDTARWQHSLDSAAQVLRNEGVAL